jgi:hypothetical protein
MTSAHFAAGSVLLALLAMNASAQDCEQYAKSNFQVLREASTFSVYAVGEQPSTPPEQVALRCMLTRDDARDLLAGLFIDATPSGKLFAAAGMSLIAPPEGDRLFTALREQDEQVSYAAGCIVKNETVSSLAQLLQSRSELRRQLIAPRPDVSAALTLQSDDLQRR